MEKYILCKCIFPHMTNSSLFNFNENIYLPYQIRSNFPA